MIKSNVITLSVAALMSFSMVGTVWAEVAPAKPEKPADVIQQVVAAPSDKAVVLAGIKKIGMSALLFSHSDFQQDREMIMAVIEHGSYELRYLAGDLKKDKLLVLAAIKARKDPNVLRYIDESLVKDKAFVLQVAEIDGAALFYADDSLKNDKEIIMAAVSKGGLKLRHVNAELRKDKELVLAAVKAGVDPEALRYAGETLRKDKEFVKAAVLANPQSASFMHLSLKEDEAFVKELVAENKELIPYLMISK